MRGQRPTLAGTSQTVATVAASLNPLPPTLCRRGGQAVLSDGRDPHHHRGVAGEVCPLALSRPNLLPGSCQGRLAEACCGILRNKDGITTGGAPDLGLITATGLECRTACRCQACQGDMGTQLECHAQNSRQGGHSDRKGHRRNPKGPGPKAFGSGIRDVQQSPPFQASNNAFRYTTEEFHSIATEYTTDKEATERLAIPSSREATLGSSNTAPSDTTIRDAKRGTKGGKKRCKRCPQWVTNMADNDDNDKKEYGSSMGCVTTATHSVKRQVRPLTDHFERLLKEACLNHAYHIKYNLKDSDMMKNFMTSGSLTQGRELEEDPGGSDMMPFPREDAVMTFYDGRPL
jgi:hypothetical protein